MNKVYINSTYRKISSFFFLFIFSFFVQAKVDNHSFILTNIDSLLEISYQHILKIEIDSAIIISSEALVLSESVNYSEGITRANYQIGEMLMTSGKYREANDYFLKASKEKFAKSTPLYMAQIQKQFGQINTYLHLFDLAKEDFAQAMQTAQKIEREDYRDYILSQLYECTAHVYTLENTPDSVYIYLKKNKILLESMEEAFAYPNLVNVYASLGLYHIQNNHITTAEKNLEKALVIADKYDFPYLSRIYIYYGDLALLKNEPEKQIEYLRKAIQNIERTTLTTELPDVYNNLSETFSRLGEPDSAQYYKHKALEVQHDLIQDKLELSNHTLSLIKEQQQQGLAKRLRNRGVIGILILILLIGACVFYYFRYKSSKQLRAKDQEIQSHQRDIAKAKHQYSEEFDKILHAAKTNDPSYTARFKEAYPDFTNKLLKLHPDLTMSEFQLCAMMYQNIPTKQIATYTYVTERSVPTKRYRLRKKMNLPTEVDMYAYLFSIAE